MAWTCLLEERLCHKSELIMVIVSYTIWRYFYRKIQNAADLWRSKMALFELPNFRIYGICWPKCEMWKYENRHFLLSLFSHFGVRAMAESNWCLEDVRNVWNSQFFNGSVSSTFTHFWLVHVCHYYFCTCKLSEDVTLCTLFCMPCSSSNILQLFEINFCRMSCTQLIHLATYE